MVHAKHLLTSFLLAVLATVSGCSQMPKGLDVTLGVNLDPLGVNISIKNPASVTASGPDGFAIPAATQP